MVPTWEQDQVIVLSQVVSQPPFLTLTPLLVQNIYIYLWKVDSARRRTAQEYVIGWQAPVSRRNPRLKSLNQTGRELNLARAHLRRMPPTLSFYNFVLWWKLLKPLGYTSLQNRTFAIWEYFMGWGNFFLSWAAFQVGPKVPLLHSF